MNVLLVDEELPWPLNTGKRLRTYNLVKRLQEKHTVYYVCHGEASELSGCPNVKVYSIPSPIVKQQGVRFYFDLFANIFSPRPYVVDRHHSPGIKKVVKSILENNAIDLIHCEWTPYTVNIMDVLEEYPTVLSTHNVEALIWRRYWEQEKNLLKKMYIKLQWLKMERYEKDASRLYDHVMCVSEEDAETFIKSFNNSAVTVVPNGVDVGYFVPQDIPEKQHSMVFTGSMDWRPNQDAVNYFVDEIFPLVRQKIADATFVIVGRNPPKDMAERWQSVDGVVVTGTVDDVRKYIAEASLYVVPLRIGGGSRLKILEALAMNKKLLSTSVGAEGLDLRDGAHLYLADTSDAFAQKAIDVLLAPVEHEGIAAAGREQALNHYSWDSITEIMDGVWKQAGEDGNG
jgi:glycosyltransferase involved in cell wall biosynthesis